MKKRMVKIIMLVLLLMMSIGISGCNTISTQTEETAVADAKTPEAETASKDKEGKRIYFAAPLFSEGERDYNLKIVEILESYGYEVFLPQRDGFLAPELTGLSDEEKIKKIFDKDVEEVMKSDIVFMLLDGRVPDEGGCVELGMAYANGKRCYGFKSDPRILENGLELNPMIAGCFIKCFHSTNGDELISLLKEYLENNDL